VPSERAQLERISGSVDNRGSGALQRVLMGPDSTPDVILERVMRFADGALPPRNIRPGTDEKPVSIQETGVGSLLRLLRRRMWLMSAVGVACGLLGWMIGRIQTPVYRAGLSLEVEGPADNQFQLRNVEPNPESSTVTDAYVATQASILHDPALVEKALDGLGWPLPVRQPNLFDRVVRAVGLDHADAATHERQLAQVLRALTVRIQPQSHLIEVAMESPDPEYSAAVANSIAEHFVDRNLESRWDSAQQINKWLARPLGEFKAKYEQSAKQLRDYARSTGLTFQNENETSVDGQKLAQLQEELSRAAAERILKQSRYELARTSSPDNLQEVADNQALREYQAKLTELRRQLAEMNATFTPAYFKVGSTQAQIAELETAVQRVRDNVLSRLRGDFDAAVRREELVRQEFSAQSQVVNEQLSTSIHYSVLKKDMDTNRDIYESTLRKIKETGVSAAVHATNIQIVSQARAPLDQEQPKPLMNAVLGMIGGVFFSFVWCFVKDQNNRTLGTPGELESLLRVPELGLVPTADLGQGKDLELTIPILAPEQLPKNVRVTMTLSRTNSLGFAVQTSENSAMAGSIRSVLASLMLTERSGIAPRVVLVSSPGRGEGKTTIATNLAILLAETYRNVLLVDGDLQNPQLHKIFGMPNSFGLGDVLQDELPVEGYPTPDAGRLACPTHVRGLAMMVAGEATTHPSSPRYRQRLDALFSRLRREFDAIVIDAPPVLDSSPDARVLGCYCDGVVLVTRSGRTTGQEAASAASRLWQDQTPVLGSVLNAWEPKHSRGPQPWRGKETF
jgi:succinoglycan biosynthesis transport protein ExoP